MSEINLGPTHVRFLIFICSGNLAEFLESAILFLTISESGETKTVFFGKQWLLGKERITESPLFTSATKGK